MKVYVEPQAWMGRGIRRVSNALIRYAPPGIVITPELKQADLEIVHVVGWGSIGPDLGKRPYAIVQYCLATTEDPDPVKWNDKVWKGARSVWSYYDLPTEQLYLAPLGVDRDVFKRNGVCKRIYKIGTSGYVANPECIGEAHAAVRMVGGNHFHLGPVLDFDECEYQLGIDDDEVAKAWRQCEYISALRRDEGFELPGFEGLACGARPIAFDTPIYRRWFGEWAEYVPEVEPNLLIEHLKVLLSNHPRPVTEDERGALYEQCDWKKLTEQFWARVL